MAHAPTQRRISLEEYHELIERDVLGEDDLVELLDGELVPVTPQRDGHTETIQRLTALLAPVARDLRVQLPIPIPPNSEPEPDLALATHIGPSKPREARLVIEVVETQWRAAVRKLPIYASAAVGEYWIVHVPKRCVHVHTGPSGRAYEHARVLSGDDVLAPPGTDIRFTVGELFAFLDED